VLLQVCCCGPTEQEISISCYQVLSSSHSTAHSTVGAANAGSAALSADAES